MEPFPCVAVHDRRESWGKIKKTCIRARPNKKKTPHHREENEQHGQEVDRGCVHKHAGSCRPEPRDPDEPVPLGIHTKCMLMCSRALFFRGHEEEKHG